MIYQYGRELGEEEEGIEKDMKKSIEFYEKSIEMNNPHAMYKLASIYELGKGETSVNFEMIVDLFDKSSKLNHSSSLSCLAYIYQSGSSGKIEIDIQKALDLYEKSASLNNLSSINNLAIFNSHGIF